MKNKRHILLWIFVSILIFTGIAWVMISMKYTIGSAVLACIQEKAEFAEYVHWEKMPEGENFKDHKEKVICQIRTDRAARKREAEEEERKTLVSAELHNFAESIKDGYLILDKTDSVEENTKVAQDYMDLFRRGVPSGTECELAGQLEQEILDALSYNWANDVYFPGKDLDEIQEATARYVKSLKGAQRQTEIRIEQLEPGIYDPVPDMPMADHFRTEIEEIRSTDTQETYDYILRYSECYQAAGEEVMRVDITVISGVESYKILCVNVKISSHMDRGIVPSGSVYFYSGENPIQIERLDAPIVLDIRSMETKAEQFVGFLRDIFTLYERKDQSVEEMYAVFCAEMEEALQEDDGEQEVLAEGVEEQEVLTEGAGEQETEKEDEDEYETLLLNTSYAELTDEIEAAYSKDTEWGAILALEEYLSGLYGEMPAILYARYFSENPDLKEENGITDQDLSVFIEEDAIIKRLGNFPEAVLVQKEILTPGEETLEGKRCFEDLYESASQGYADWYDEPYPAGLCGGRFQYLFENFCTVEVEILLTEQGPFLVAFSLQWMDDEAALEELTGYRLLLDAELDFYHMPNYLKMRAEAEAALDRSQYETDEAYELDFCRWLYRNYPEYYRNPDQNPNYGQGSYGGGYSAPQSILNGMKAGVSNFWDGVGDATQGTLFGYIFTDNGSFRSFSDDVRHTVNDVKDAVNEVKSEVKNWWNNDVKSWWNNLWH